MASALPVMAVCSSMVLNRTPQRALMPVSHRVEGHWRSLLLTPCPRRDLVKPYHTVTESQNNRVGSSHPFFCQARGRDNANSPSPTESSYKIPHTLSRVFLKAKPWCRGEATPTGMLSPLSRAQAPARLPEVSTEQKHLCGFGNLQEKLVLR